MNSFIRGIYFKNEIVKETGPSVNSENIEERITARRNRIQQRLELQKYLEEKVHLGFAQKEFSNQQISKLINDGDSFISNVRIACEARENLRKAEEEELTTLRTQNIDKDTATCIKLFNEINEQWTVARDSILPTETRDLLNKQNALCTNLISEKNNLIDELNLEIKGKDDHYVRELKKRIEDIDILSERMESQIQAMQKTYCEEIDAIENAFLAHRKKLLDEQNNEWTLLMNEIKQKQISYMERNSNQNVEYEKELHNLRNKYSDEYNALKIDLESEIEILENQLLKLKATYQLNLEKLDYNFQILKRRDEENLIIKSKQKRKITKQQDLLNKLHITELKQYKQYMSENEQLSEDYKKRMENYRDLQKKAKLIMESEYSNFCNIWLMNEESMKKSANRLLDASRLINEQQLGLQWTRPDVSFMDNVGPLNNSKNKVNENPPAVTAMRLAHAKTEVGSGEVQNENKILNTAVPTKLKQVSPEIVYKFLQLLCKEADFLIEDKLKILFKPLSNQEEMLIRLDTILTALGVSNDDDLDLLFSYFIQKENGQKPYLKRENSLSFRFQSIKSENCAILESETFKIEAKCNSLDFETLNVNDDVKNDLLLHSESTNLTKTCTKLEDLDQSERTMYNLGDPFSNSRVTDVHDSNVINQNSWSLIAAADVISALHDFSKDMQIYEPVETRKNIHSDNAISEENNLNKAFETNNGHNAVDAEYWNKYAQLIVTPDEELIWDNLFIAMSKYYNVLKHRKKLSCDTDELRKQNAEMRDLLKKYMGSKINHELQIPPIKTMQLN